MYEYAMSHSLPMLFSNEIHHQAGIREKANVYKDMRKTEMIKDVFAFSSISKIGSYRFKLFGTLLKLKQYHSLALLSCLESQN